MRKSFIVSLVPLTYTVRIEVVHLCTADAIAGISCAVLLALFLVQRYGTGRIGTAFSPVLILWFLSNAAIGIYNIAR